MRSRSCDPLRLRAGGTAPLPARSSTASSARRTATVVVLGVAGVVTLSACTSFVRQVSEFQEGWRIAKVVALAKASGLPPGALTDCRTAASPAELASSRFALLAYPTVGGRHHRHIVIVDDLTTVAPGDTVYTNVLRCGSSLEVRPSSQQELAAEAQATLVTSSKGHR